MAAAIAAGHDSGRQYRAMHRIDGPIDTKPSERQAKNLPGCQIKETLGYHVFGTNCSDSYLDLWGQLLPVLADRGDGQSNGADGCTRTSIIYRELDKRWTEGCYLRLE